MALELRDYQSESINQLRDGIRRGFRKQVLCLPTGGGKTEVAIALASEAMAKQSNVAFLCDRQSLVHQSSQRFYRAGIHHGIAMGDSTRGRYEAMQICSQQTIEKRGFIMANAPDLVVVDECHSQRKWLREYLAAHPDLVTIGLSATPFSRGLGDTYSAVVNATTTNRLLQQGWLSPLRVFTARRIDMTGAKKSGGEWTHGEAESRAMPIIGDIVTEWVQRTNAVFGKPVKTLLFGPTVSFCNEVCRAFQAAGYDFRPSSFRDSPEETNEMVGAFKSGRFIGLASVDKFVKGFDVPDVLCLISARPYSGSFTNHIQQLGRVMRPAPGKEFALVLDHADNYLPWFGSMAEFFENGCGSLAADRRERKRKEPEERKQASCRNCGCIFHPGDERCVQCGVERPRRKSRDPVLPGHMEEVAGVDGSDWLGDSRWIWAQLCRIATRRSFKSVSESKAESAEAEEAKAKARRFCVAQFKTIYKRWPPKGWQFEPDWEEADPRVEGFVRKSLARYRRQMIAIEKAKAKRAAA